MGNKCMIRRYGCEHIDVIRKMIICSCRRNKTNLRKCQLFSDVMGYDDVYNAIRSEASPKSLNCKRHFKNTEKYFGGRGVI